MVEKSEFRSHGAQAVGMLISEMTSTDYACFIKWLFNFSRHTKVRRPGGHIFNYFKNICQMLHIGLFFSILYCCHELDAQVSVPEG